MSNKKTHNSNGHFDKFMDDLLKRQEASRKKFEEMKGPYKETPQMKRNKMIREKPMNRIVVDTKK
tara:strand:+ start:3186 stop:3380 length:195 start_codon:yes stop_codon:yes gene_type:complete